MVFIEPLNKIE